MEQLKGKKILVGVTGSISAYKIPLLVRELVKAGAEVKVLMTGSARYFVTKEVLSNLSRNPVTDDMFAYETMSDGAWHIHAAHAADLYIIAPCSATTLGKLASGIADNAVTAMAIAMPQGTPVLIAPAMDSTMWLNPITQGNVRKLESIGWRIIPPEEGELSSGITGPGRLPEPGTLAEIIRTELIAISIRENNSLQPTPDELRSNDKLNAEIEFELLKQKSNTLYGKKILITAGPTREKIDDVRFISNFSSGKMGYAIAEKAHIAGAEVTLVSGPVNMNPPAGVKVVYAESATEMFESVETYRGRSDVLIFVAAVADFAPKVRSTGKIKKADMGDKAVLELVPTKDILAHAGTNKREGQVIVGFALESDNEIENAEKKLKEKNCDLVVLNSANKEGSGFGGDNNTITILTREGSITDYPAMTKEKCAEIILDKISGYFPK